MCRQMPRFYHKSGRYHSLRAKNTEDDEGKQDAQYKAMNA